MNILKKRNPGLSIGKVDRLRSWGPPFIDFLFGLMFVIGCLIDLSPAHAQPTFIHFEEYPVGNRIEYQYQGLGAHPHFLNDYMPGKTAWRTSPTIEAHPNARSGANVLVNDYSDMEFSSSKKVPMVIWFEQPVSGVGMWLGTRTSCSGTVQAKVSVHDCNGGILGEKTATVSSAFNTPLEIDDTQGRIRRVMIDYGDSYCPEAIDEFAFQIGSGQCTDSTAPKVTITSHTNFEVVPTNSVLIEGTVLEYSGIIAALEMNGNPITFYPQEGGAGMIFKFSHNGTLHGGSNTITVLAYDGGGNKGSASVTLNLGVPSSFSIGQFHLTQRGIMQNTSCDVDSSGGNREFVAGKSAIVQIFLQVKTASGDDTYVSSVEMKLYRREGLVDKLVDSFMGTGVSPLLSTFKSPSQMAGIHFWIPGDKFDVPGEYKFEFQAYVGMLNPVGPKLVAKCGGPAMTGEYFKFTETKPIRVFVMPVEAANTNPNHTADHIKNYYGQFHSMARTFPVRDGFSETWENKKTGVYYVESDPLRLCDGTETMHQQFPNVCEGTGWTWRLTDKDPSGTLRRANHFFVYDPTNTNITCGQPNRRTLGGMVTFGGALLTGPLDTVNFVPALGVFRPGAHPEWGLDDGTVIKYYVPIDDDHDGMIGMGDLQHFVAEFFDNQSGLWTTNLAFYNHGETYRFFRDQDGNHCQTRDSKGNLTEPQADVIKLWENAGKVAYHAAEKAMDAYYEQIPNAFILPQNRATFASLWFPVVVHPENYDFNFWGPGSSSGRSNWIRVTNDQTMAHEMGHNVGNLVDTYWSGGCMNPPNRLNVWAAYVGFESLSGNQLNDLWDVMDCSGAPERFFFNDKNYDTLFSALKMTTSSSAQTEALAATEGQKFMMKGRITPNGQAENVQIGLGVDLEDTPINPLSPYKLVFGSGREVLSEYPFSFEDKINPPQGYSSWPLPFVSFRVVAPFPTSAEWVELRFKEDMLSRFVRSRGAPSVRLLYPSGGESFGANDEVTIRWASRDPDEDILLHTLYYSPDGNSRWMLIAAGVAGNEYRWKLADVPGTPRNEGLIRIVASDGFNTGEDTIGGVISIAGKPPMVAILYPQSNQVFLQCEPIRLQGVAKDPQGQLQYILWYVDDMLVNYSNDLNPVIGPLSPGMHKITLGARDVNGVGTITVIWIKVLADSDCDGMSDEYEEAHGLNPGFAEDATWDNDGDGLSNLEESWRGTDPNVPDRRTLMVNVNPSGGGVIRGGGMYCSGTCSSLFNLGTIVTLTATEGTGYIFSRWENCDSPSGMNCMMRMYNDRTVTVHFGPAAATLISPSGTITDNTPTYIWNAVLGSTWYYLWVNDSTGNKIKQWYTASQAGCGAGTGTCSVTPSASLANGSGQWWIQTWNTASYGPWSSGMSFNVSPFSYSRDEIIGTWSSGIWYYNTATSHWTKMYSNTPSGPIAVGDVTGDGKADVISCWSSGLWYQNGATLGWTKVWDIAPQ